MFHMEHKPFVTARTAAAALGVSIERIVADIDAGMDGNLSALIGAAKDGVYYLPRWEIEGERLAMHRARLADGDAVCNVQATQPALCKADEANVTQPDSGGSAT